MAQLFDTLYDLSITNPVTVSLYPVTVTALNTSYYTGAVKRAFLAGTFAMYTSSAGGTPLVRGKDYILVQSDADVSYSSQYSVAIYSSFQLIGNTLPASTVYITCQVVASYNSAAPINAHEQRLDVDEANITALQAGLATETNRAEVSESNLQTAINSEITRAEAAESTLTTNLSAEVTRAEGVETALQTRATNDETTMNGHISNSAIHVTAQQVAKWNGDSTTYVVANHAAMVALTGLNVGDSVYVVADTDGNRAVYMWDGSTYQLTSDQGWMNTNINWSALTAIPANVTALGSSTLKSTALTDMPQSYSSSNAGMMPVIKSDGSGYQLVTPLQASGVGNVVDNTASVDSDIAIFSGTTGTLIKDSGTKISTDGTFASIVDTLIPSVKAIYTFLNNLLPIGSIMDFAGTTIPGTLWASANGASLSRTTYSALWGVLSATNNTLATTTLSTNTLFTIIAHGYQTGDCIAVANTTGTLPSGIAAETNLYVINVSTSTFKVASSLANAFAGTAIGTTAGSGNCTIRWNPFGISSSTTFNLPDLQGIGTIGSGTQTLAPWASAYYAGRLGQYIQDQGQSHIHNFANGATIAWDQSGSVGSAYGTYNMMSGTTIGTPANDGTHGAPRSGYITQGPVVGMNKMIRIQ